MTAGADASKYKGSKQEEEGGDGGIILGKKGGKAGKARATALAAALAAALSAICWRGRVR